MKRYRIIEHTGWHDKLSDAEQAIEREIFEPSRKICKEYE